MADTDTKPSPKRAKPWHDKLKDYREAIESKWSTQRENLDRLYSREERADSADREYAIFWANIEVLKPATYARTPVPVVAPRHKQPNPIASSASELLERSLITTFDVSDVDGCMKEVRDEFLRYSRGTGWARLGVDRNEVERVEFDHVTGDDFAHDPARTWREVTWVARRAWLTRKKGAERFDKILKPLGKSFKEVPLKKRDPNSAAHNPKDKAAVWEFWDKETGQVVWIAEDFDFILDQSEPWLDLSSFWPCPKPAYGTLAPKTLKPVPDIRQYKDQIEEINEYTARIAALSEQLRLKGFYPSGAGELSDAIETALKSVDDRAVLVPISSWAQFGGASPKDMVVWLPVKDVLELVRGLVELRRVVIDDVYQITGIADIVRGQSDPNETLGAQQLKSQWGSARIRERQNELIRFARDLTRISGEIMAENFQPKTLMDMAQMKLPTAEEKAKVKAQLDQMQDQAPPELKKMMDKPSFEEVMEFLSDDRTRGFTIEIETDSTIQPDEDAEKNRRTEFVTAVGGLFQQAAPLVQQAPQLGPFMGEVLKFAAQGFRAGRPLESAIDQLVDQMQQMAVQAQQPPQEPPPDPAMEAKQAEAQMKLEGLKAQTEAKVIGAQADIAKTQAQTEAELAKQSMNGGF